MMFTDRAPGDVEAEIRMTRLAFAGTIFVLEGETDSRFWKPRIRHKDCDIVIAGGKNNVVDSLANLERAQFDGVLGVVDSDLDRIEGVRLPSTNIATTDFHDLETMLICSPALDKILAELGSATKIQHFERTQSIQAALLERALPLGRLRWLSQRNRLNLQFRKLTKRGLRRLNYSAFVARKTWELDPKAMVAEVLNFSSRHDLQAADLLEEMDSLPQEHEAEQLCNGHDLVGILAIGLNGVLGSRKVSDEELEELLRLAYEWVHLSGTQLCRIIRNWETPQYRVLAHTT